MVVPKFNENHPSETDRFRLQSCLVSSAILFDLDNTLIDRDAAFQRLVRHEFGRNSGAVQSLLELDQGGYGDRDSLLRRWEGYSGRLLAMPELGTAIALHLEPDGAFIDSLKTLAGLATVGIVTNGGSVSQLAKVKAAGLDRVVPRDRIWISEEVGLKKPNPALFQLVARELQVPVESCLYLGDQPELDVAAAERAGMAARLVHSPLIAEDIDRLVEVFRCRQSGSTPTLSGAVT